MATIADLRLDEATWASGTDLRRAEWRVVRDELLEDGVFAAPLGGLFLLATPSTEAVTLEALDQEGFVRHLVTLPRTLLAESVREYVAIIRRLDENADHRDATWVEAVDMAKKVVHDRAAAVIAKAAPELSTDLPTLRRVFTFVFSLLVDTTRMQHARGHHAPRA
jgi:uncharacterized protein (UPF0262 family)